MSKNSTNNYHITSDTITFGIDQSYSNFAVVVFRGDVVIDRAVFHAGADTPANREKQYKIFLGDIISQLMYIQRQFDFLVEMYNPSYLVFEGLSFGSKGDRVFQLGGLYFHIAVNYLNKFDHNTVDNIITISPTAAKSFARSHLPEESQCLWEGVNKVLLKSGKPKLKPMKKQDMREALRTTSDRWILDGYAVSSKTTPSGVYDLSDAYFIGKTFIKNNM